MNPCIFCEIIKAYHPQDIIFEDPYSIAFLDKNSVFLGHTLLIPKVHIPTFAELPQNYIEPFFTNAQRLIQAIELALNVDGTFMAINNKVSQSVPHLHMHLIPRKFKDGLRGFFWPRKRYENNEQKKEIILAIQLALTENDDYFKI